MDVVKIAEDLIAINSINPFTMEKEGIAFRPGTWTFKGNETEILTYLESLLRKQGFRIQRQPVHGDSSGKGFYNLLAEKGRGSKSILFYGHVDTVEIKDGWSTDPLRAVRKSVDGQERMYGLGANDMKGGLATMLAATAALDPKDYKIKLAFLIDEENFSLGAVKFVESDFLKDVILAVVPETMDFERRTKGQPILLGRMGRAEYLFEVRGVACHGAQCRVNKEAVNAVHQSVKLQGRVIQHCEENAQAFSHGELSVVNSMYISYHEGGKALLTVPDRALFVLERLFVMNEDMDKEVAALESVVKRAYEEGTLDPRSRVSVTRKVRPTVLCKPYFFSPENPMVRKVTEIVDRVAGGHEYGIGMSVADENRIADKGITTLIIGPDGEGCHSPNEWVGVESLRRLEKIYTRIATDIGPELAGRK
jgi:acetylornithine deacetylase/succinyl-diaminopimelate desuccinylase-like protein